MMQEKLFCYENTLATLAQLEIVAVLVFTIPPHLLCPLDTDGGMIPNQYIYGHEFPSQMK